MIIFKVLCAVSVVVGIQCNTVTSPQIRILDVATKASETRLIPQRIDYRNGYHPYFQQQNNYKREPLKSYVIYDEYPLKIFKEWKASSHNDFPPSGSPLEYNRQQNPEVFYQNEQNIVPPPKPTLAYHSVYSNIIKVFDESLDNVDRNRFQSERYVKPYEGSVWKSQPGIQYEPIHPQEIPRRYLHGNFKLPENFPDVFLPNFKFQIPAFDGRVPQPPRIFYPPEGFYGTQTINYNKEGEGRPDEVELLPEVGHKNKRKQVFCNFIKVNDRQFPKSGNPCARTEDDIPVSLPEFPDYSNLPDDKIPVEHRRQHFQIKRIKRSEINATYESRQKREAGFGYGYSGWGSPFGYDNNFFGDNYPNRGNYRGYGNNYNNNNNNRDRNQGYRNRFYGGSRYEDYDDDYNNNDDSNSRGLTGYLTNGGRRYRNRKNNNDDEEDDDDNNDNNNNNNENDSDEEMERMNSNRRDSNDRRNNDDSRDRRRNNNNNNNGNNNNNNNNNNNYDDDDYRDNNRRNNNRNNNSRRNNNNNRRYNSDRSDYNNNNSNNNRNRYYSGSSNNNGYGSNGYSSNGYNSNGYGSNSYNNNGYGSNGYNNNGYGSSYGSYGSNYGGYGSGGYGGSYGNNGGYGYGGYGNGFSSF